MPNLDEMERQAKMELAALRRHYMEEAKPIIDRLVRIEAMRPPQPFFINIAGIDPSRLDTLNKIE